MMELKLKNTSLDPLTERPLAGLGRRDPASMAR